MAKTAKLSLFLIAIIFPFGQLLRLNIQDVSFPIIDLAIFLFFLTNLIYSIKHQKIKIKNKYLLYFITFAWTSFFLNLLRYPFSLKPILYLIRLSIYLSFFILPPNKKLILPKFQKFFQLTIISGIVFALIQYTIWPDLTYFDSLNWDPHLSRLVGSFLDPTFTGLIFLLFLINTILKKNPRKSWIIITITYLALALSYSRSSLLGFVFAAFLISRHLKNKKIFIYSLIIITTTIILLPRPPGEGTKLERTNSIKAKIQNYKEAFKTFSQAPLIGHGYNNLPLARIINNPASHANFGFDNSLLTILATTGIIGLVLFLLGLSNIYKFSTPNQKISLLVVLLHSFFSNSLPYPWVLILLILYQIS